MNKNIGFVSVTGAGCGAADLITLRGLNALKSADAVIYDDLVAPELLRQASADAELIFMGKRGGKHSAVQAEINNCIAEKALQGKRVCRLKGGDPLVFGRGGEEALFLQEKEIPYEIIPGISSSIAVPAAAGIPVTHRRAARSFHVITGHTADSEDSLAESAAAYAKLPGTLLFLMGRASLKKLAQRLMEAGKDPLTPSAVVSAEKWDDPITARAPLAEIAEEADKRGVPSPAVIVIGETAGMDLRSRASLPLTGKTVAVTGSPVIFNKLSHSLRMLGAEILNAGSCSVQELPCEFDWPSLKNGAYIVFTSANGVDVFFKKLLSAGYDHRMLAECRFAVIGASTGKKLREHGFNADLCPSTYTSDALAELMISSIPQGEKVYMFRSAKGNPELRQRLTERFAVDDIAIYDLRNDSPFCEDIARADYVCFSSAAGVKMFCARYGNAIESTCICIGHPTAIEAQKQGFRTVCTAESISTDSMVEKILEYGQ